MRRGACRFVAIRFREEATFQTADLAPAFGFNSKALAGRVLTQSRWTAWSVCLGSAWTHERPQRRRVAFGGGRPRMWKSDRTSGRVIAGGHDWALVERGCVGQPIQLHALQERAECGECHRAGAPDTAVWPSVPRL
eukprot:scaffold40_cov305-Pinguiococcus_pyrenoidosus.AAC.14